MEGREKGVERRVMGRRKKKMGMGRESEGERKSSRVEVQKPERALGTGEG